METEADKLTHLTEMAEDFVANRLLMLQAMRWFEGWFLRKDLGGSHRKD